MIRRLLAIILCVTLIFSCVPNVYDVYAEETQVENTIEVVAPVKESVTATSITLKAVDGYEYSIGGEVWQDSPAFEDLLPYTSYVLYQRIASVDGGEPSEKSKSLIVKTLKLDAEAPEAPKLESVSDQVVTLKKIAGYEYSYNLTSWRTSAYFGGLKPDKTYSFYQRKAATSTHYASPASPALEVKTKKTGATGINPRVLEATATKIIVKPIKGYEYSLDGETWQDNTTFDVEPLTCYTVYQRKKETESYGAGQINTLENVYTLKATTAPKDHIAIYTKEDLLTIHDNLNGKYILMNDLEFSESDYKEGGAFYNNGKGWKPIGGYNKNFTGTFNGNGFSITGLYINQDTNEYHGLFGCNEGTIKNLGLVNCTISSIVQEDGSDQYLHPSNIVGGIAGINSGTISTCYVSGTIKGISDDAYLDNYVGGIAGYNISGKIINCFNEASIYAKNTGYFTCSAGGICGSGNAETSYNVGNVSCNENIGGISPTSGNTNCYSIDAFILDPKMESSLDGNNKYLSNKSMQKQASFEGFDFDNTWKFKTVGKYVYPVLINVDYKPYERNEGFASGNGTFYSPYVIKNETQLRNIQNNLGACYELATDIKIQGNSKNNWTPIGTDPLQPFYGFFNGKGHVIKNIQIDKTVQTGTSAGLFGYSSGLIEQVGVLEGKIKITMDMSDDVDTEGDSYAGGLAGYSTGVIKKAYNGNKVSCIKNNSGGFAEAHAGGICGQTYITRDCYNFGTIIASGNFANAAGIAASPLGTLVTTCYNTGKVVLDDNSTQEAYGIAQVSRTNCYSLPVSYAHTVEDDKTVFLTENEMHYQSSFEGFDFDNTWVFGDNYEYPQLRSVKHINIVENTTDFAGGKGTVSEPYKIKTVEHLMNVSKCPDAHFVLQNTIDMSGKEWTIIGQSLKDPFIGSIDGNGYSIKNITLNAPTDTEYVGFIGCNAGTIKNLTLKNGTIKCNNTSVSKLKSGIICGRNYFIGQIDNVKIIDTKLMINAEKYTNYVGGITGLNEGTIINSAFSGELDVSLTGTATGEIGGFTGNNDYYGTIQKTYNNGLIKGTNSHETQRSTYWGGFVGWTDGKIENCYNSGEMQIINPDDTLTSTYVSLMSAYMDDKSSLINVYHCATATVENITRLSNVYYLGSPKKFSGVYFVNTRSTSPVHGVALSENEITKSSSFSSFDFNNVWIIDNENDKKFYSPQLRSNIYSYNAKDLTKVNVQGIEKSYEYTGNAFKPTVSIDGLVNGVDYSVKYTNNVKPGTATITITSKNLELCTGSVKKTFKITLPPITPPAFTEVRLDPTGEYNEVYLKWDELDLDSDLCISSMNVYYKKASWSSYKFYEKTISCECLVEDLDPGAKYTFRIYPNIMIKGEEFKSSNYTTSKAIYTLKKVNKPTVTKSSSSQVKVSWTNINGETGYQISKSTSSLGTSLVATVKSSTATSKVISATKGTTYYYKVRAYKEEKVDGVTKKVYGPWSNVYKYKL